jgi:pSer/pThr/pTyr-binding forkhead associated (FHA) protein
MAMLIQYANGVPAIKFSLEDLKTHIGRGLDCDICVIDKYVSKEHAVIEARQSRSDERRHHYYIRDLNSTNHTYVNDMPVKQALLRDRDIIRIGEEEFVFECNAEEEKLAAKLKAFPGQEDTLEKLKVTIQQQPEQNTRFSRRLRLL